MVKLLLKIFRPVSYTHLDVYKRQALGYIRSKDLVKLKKLNTFYFHSTDKQNNFLEFPYDLYNAKKIVIYSGGRAKPFYLTSYFGIIESIKHKHKSKIKGKEKSKIEYYFEIKLKDNFSEDISIAVSYTHLDVYKRQE